MILGIYNTLKCFILLIVYAVYAVFDPVEVLTIIRLGEIENEKIYFGKSKQKLGPEA